MTVRNDIPPPRDELDPDELDALFIGLEERLAAERGPAAWLRSRSSRARLALAMGMFVGLTVTVVSLAPRSDLSILPTWRVAVVMGSLTALFGASVWLELEPLYRAGAPIWVRRLVVSGALLGMAALAWLPLAPPVPAEDPSDLSHALPCLFGGLVLVVPAAALFRWLDRGGRAGSSYLAAAGAALAANAATALHCDNDSVLHILQGHASAGLMVVGVVALWRWGMARFWRPLRRDRRHRTR